MRDCVAKTKVESDRGQYAILLSTLCVRVYVSMFQCFLMYVRVYVILNIKIAQKITMPRITETDKQAKWQMFYVTEGRKEI